MHDSKPHVILIAYYFPPAPQIGGLRPFRFRKYLQRAGYPCHVITASPQAEDGGSPDRIFVADELQRVWDEGPRERLSFAGWQELLLRKAAFPGHIGLVWSRTMAQQCRQIMAQHPHERFVLYSTYPPLGSLSAGLIARLREKIPWIADFRDPILTGIGIPPWRMRAANHALEALTFRLASSVIANTEEIANVWRQRYSVSQRKLHVILNGFDPEDAPHPREIPDRPNKLIVHAGALYHGRNPNVIIASLSRLRARGVPEALTGAVLLLGGIDQRSGIDPALCRQAQQEGWLQMRPPVPRAESQRLIEEADGLLLVQPHTRVQIPGKLFEYVCIGRPILALVPRLSAVEPILKNAETPHVCVYPDDDPQTVDAKLLAFLRLPNTPVAMNDWFRNNFNATAQTERLAALIDQAVV